MFTSYKLYCGSNLGWILFWNIFGTHIFGQFLFWLYLLKKKCIVNIPFYLNKYMIFEGKLTPKGKSSILDIAGPSILHFLNFANLSISVVYIFVTNFLFSAPKSGCFHHSLKRRFYINRDLVYKDTNSISTSVLPWMCLLNRYPCWALWTWLSLRVG